MTGPAVSNREARLGSLRFVRTISATVDDASSARYSRPERPTSVRGSVVYTAGVCGTHARNRTSRASGTRHLSNVSKIIGPAHVREIGDDMCVAVWTASNQSRGQVGTKAVLTANNPRPAT